MVMFKIRPKDCCSKNQLRIFYMHADGYVPYGYKLRPSTTVPEKRLARVMEAMHSVDPKKFAAVYRKEVVNEFPTRKKT